MYLLALTFYTYIYHRDIVFHSMCAQYLLVLIVDPHKQNTARGAHYRTQTSLQLQVGYGVVNFSLLKKGNDFI